MAKLKGIKVVIENKLYQITNIEHSKLLGLLTVGEYEEYNNYLSKIEETHQIIESADFFHYQ
ncbi:MAG: hypothetical protein M0P71_12800 [Melioribacteraceae bacterium]|nr:hypothetical protein [Melioribacteraceae bacterium]